MATSLEAALAPMLGLPWVDRTRRNHGLEHATITLLSQKIRGVSMAGQSTPFGFYLYGNVRTEELTAAVQEALRRMKGGEEHLAVHPNCGTNFATAGVLASVAAFAGFIGANSWRDRLERLPLVAVLATVALILAQPLGFAMQRYVTTSGEMRSLQVVEVRLINPGRVPVHFVKTAG